MTIKDIRDIEREEAERKKKEISDDASEVVTDIFKKIGENFERNKREKEKKKSSLRKIIEWILGLFLVILILDLFLGSIWLLRFFIKSFLGI